jgi:hypothetical protein
MRNPLQGSGGEIEAHHRTGGMVLHVPAGMALKEEALDSALAEAKALPGYIA